MEKRGVGPLNFRETLRYDLPASLVVFLVALPLSLGIAIASGAPVLAGLIAAVVGGIVAGAMGGSPLQVSGPAAGLTVVVAELVAEFGWLTTCAITVGAGVLQIGFGLSRVATAALAIAPVVVHAMLAGIGITIALQQIHVLLGGDSASSAWQNLVGLPNQLADIGWSEALVGGLVVAVMLLWPSLPASVRKVPGPLAAIVAATAMTLLLRLDVERITIDGNFFEALALPELPSGNWAAFAMGVLTVALIASVESLLSAVAVDKMHTGPRSDLNRELIGQGSANVASGMLGGLPVTGVIVRSSTNVASGARTRASAILHGVWVLLFAVVLTGLVEQIPRAALAGLLVVIGMQLVKLAHMRSALRTGDVWVYAVTVTAVVFLNLLEGVAIGLAVAVAMVVARVVRAEITSEPLGTEGSRQWRVTIRGSLSFLSLPKLNKALGRVPEAAHLTLELDTDFLDHASSEMLEDFRWAHESGGGTVLVVEKGKARLADAPRRPPRRHTTGLVGLTPWRHSSRAESADVHRHPASLRSIIGGVDAYHAEHADALAATMADITERQDPDSLFLTCADSRLLPNVITASGPGDLFTVRNVGNLVPAVESGEESVDAAIEYALTELGVGSIVICGHSSCGAMNALIASEEAGLPDGAVGNWLRHGVGSLAAFRQGHAAGRAAAALGFGRVDQLAVVNVAKQVEYLGRHRLVGPAAAEARVRIVGLFFDIVTARVYEVTTTTIRPVGRVVEQPTEPVSR
ncbi:bifunctional SulP family inorganic anion transporter/carbonic anhydrase [Gordonia sp. ABSL1-1]|uniref:bifunctional SulP family inorganic anion transporter/carbonic anhydrase n=1 Tax=Gordonia sp. ABSL1-1 TaxID=3053923 RepID=UPI0025734077|nr:bifunctional SulP family inorganic anion transporter/carbonic anhydrase [Gordonia sp. ABSL1-1]MDL9935202.1 bifunctional SulP family inorganic anion transporter/carbonic anhydrase [Gordonia sp. ABSL1-1]